MSHAEEYDQDPTGFYDMLRDKLMPREAGTETSGQVAMRFLVREGGVLPTRGHQGDAGFDLYVSQDTVLLPDHFVDVPCAVHVELPAGHWGLLIGRSSTLRKLGLMVTQGVIDEGYRGELFAGCWNLTRLKVQVRQGMRLAQLIPIPLVSDGMRPVEVDELGKHSRGDNGFGSTGD